MKKILAMIALMLCFSMLFVSCAKMPPEDNGDADDEGEEPKVESLDAAGVIDALTKNEITVETLADAYKLFEEYALEITNLKLDDSPAPGDMKISWKGNKIAVIADGVTQYMQLGDDSSVFNVQFSGAEVYESGFSLADMPDVNGVEFDKFNIEPIAAEDLKDEGDGVFSVKREYIDSLIDAIIDALMAEGEVPAEQSRETKALIKGYTDDIVFDVKIKTEGDKIVSTSCSIDIGNDVYVDFANNMLGAGDLVTKIDYEHKFNVSMTYNFKDGKYAGLEAAADINMVSNIFEADEGADSVCVEFTTCKADVKLDISDLKASAAKIIDFELTMKDEVLGYTKNGDKYTYDAGYFNADYMNTSSMTMTASLIGTDFKFTTNSNDVWYYVEENKAPEKHTEDESSTFTCTVKFGDVEIAELTGDAKAYYDLYVVASKKADVLEQKAREELETALAKVTVDSSKYWDVYEIYVYVDEYNAYVVFTVELYSGEMSATVSDIYFTEPYAEYFVNNGTLYSTDDPETPVTTLGIDYNGGDIVITPGTEQI